MVNKRGITPGHCSHHMTPCAHYSCFRNAAVFYRAVTVCKIINDQVSTIDYVVEMIVRQLNNRALSIKTKLIDGGYHIIVSVKLSGCKDVVSGVVEQDVQRNVDPGTIITRYLCGKMRVHGYKSRLRIRISLVE